MVGKELASLYAEAEKFGGFRAKLTLAQLVEVPTSLADVLPDTPERLAKARKALDGLRAKGPAKATAPVARELLDSPTEFASISLDLMATKDAWIHDLDAASRKITSLAARTMGVERAGVWILGTSGTTLHCVVTYIASKATFEGKDVVLSGFDYPAYFQAVRTEGVLDAANAHTDPRTSGFSASYLTPLGIQSMLDIPLWANGSLRGVLCCEHVGPKPRDWSPSVQRFGLTLTQILSQHWTVAGPARTR